MRAILLEVPQSDLDWQRWGEHHRQDHDLIRAAIQQQRKINLAQYQLDPIATDALEQWLSRNQQAHSDMLGALGQQGHDLEDVDVTDNNQLTAWIFTHYQEHLTAGTVLGV